MDCINNVPFSDYINSLVTFDVYILNDDTKKSITVQKYHNTVLRIHVIGTVYPNIPLSSASLHGHPRSSIGATLGVRMSRQPMGTSQPCPVYGQ